MAPYSSRVFFNHFNTFIRRSSPLSSLYSIGKLYWLDLPRFYQSKSTAGIRGDFSEEFSFATFFPEFLRLNFPLILCFSFSFILCPLSPFLLYSPAFFIHLIFSFSGPWLEFWLLLLEEFSVEEDKQFLRLQILRF